MKLSQVKKGQVVKIARIPNEQVRSQAIRFGIGEGSIVICEEIIPAGPVILRKNRQEIAVGRGLAEEITIQAVS
ncbi:MAG: Fe2+ transport system protein [Peptococcaceae bacterium]|jgi:Fe2+ transport system protein FeoA|nr:Fe2+ transport system protein [Peptococcaceae bacterium]